MVTLEEFVNEVKNTTEPWLKERTEHGIGPQLIYTKDNKFLLYKVIDSTPSWSFDAMLCVDIINVKNAITMQEMLHGIMLCLEARVDNNVSWQL